MHLCYPVRRHVGLPATTLQWRLNHRITQMNPWIHLAGYSCPAVSAQRGNAVKQVVRSASNNAPRSALIHSTDRESAPHRTSGHSRTPCFIATCCGVHNTLTTRCHPVGLVLRHLTSASVFDVSLESHQLIRDVVQIKWVPVLSILPAPRTESGHSRSSPFTLPVHPKICHPFTGTTRLRDLCLIATNAPSRRRDDVSSFATIKLQHQS